MALEPRDPRRHLDEPKAVTGLERYKISVATACYKSEKFINRTFQSLVSQNYQNLEWSVVVDGRLDRTLEVLEHCRDSVSFPITIRLNETNQGATTAITSAIEGCTGDFSIVLDHDDELMPDAINQLVETWERVARDHDIDRILGIMARCVDEQGRIIGRLLDREPFVGNWGHYHHVKRCKGEGALLVRTEILKKYYRFSTDEFGATNGLIWNRMDRDYQSIFTNQIVRRYHTNVAGSMSSQTKIQYPSASAGQALEYLNDNAEYLWADPRFFLKTLVSYERLSAHAGRSVASSLAKLKARRLRAAGLCLAPLALVLAARDRLTGRV
jgi:glycosyltransferase involved in cell wall biosynthesis